MIKHLVLNIKKYYWILQNVILNSKKNIIVPMFMEQVLVGDDFRLFWSHPWNIFFYYTPKSATCITPVHIIYSMINTLIRQYLYHLTRSSSKLYKLVSTLTGDEWAILRHASWGGLARLITAVTQPLIRQSSSRIGRKMSAVLVWRLVTIPLMGLLLFMWVPCFHTIHVYGAHYCSFNMYTFMCLVIIIAVLMYTLMC